MSDSAHNSNSNSGGLSRVISQGSDIAREEEEQLQQQQKSPPQHNLEIEDSVPNAPIFHPMESNFVPNDDLPLVLDDPHHVDTDDNDNTNDSGAGFLQIFANQQHLESSSSLSSNEYDEKLVNIEEEQPQPARIRRKQTLHRMPSGGSSNSSKRAASSGSSRDWGWFTEDVHNSTKLNILNEAKKQARIASTSDNDLSAMAVTAPTYIFEESISTQLLWKMHAGLRPPQPAEERAFYEKMWAQNFARSQVDYKMPVEVLLSPSPISLNPFAEGNFETGATDYTMPANQGNDLAEFALVNRMEDPVRSQQHHVVNKIVRDSAGEEELIVVVRGDNVFGTTVSKSFARVNEDGDTVPGVVDTVNISVASYRVVESKKHGKYAQFLVIYREGSIRDTVGVWKRYSDFEELAHKVTQAHEGCAAAFANISPLSIAEEPEMEHLPNAITSWRLLKKRQRWYRCLDAGYLSLKVFLLERFLHDILFESSSPQLLRDFVGVDSHML